MTINAGPMLCNPPFYFCPGPSRVKCASGISSVPLRGCWIVNRFCLSHPIFPGAEGIASWFKKASNLSLNYNVLCPLRKFFLYFVVSLNGNLALRIWLVLPTFSLTQYFFWDFCHLSYVCAVYWDHWCKAKHHRNAFFQLFHLFYLNNPCASEASFKKAGMARWFREDKSSPVLRKGRKILGQVWTSSAWTTASLFMKVVNDYKACESLLLFGLLPITSRLCKICLHREIDLTLRP